MNKKNRIKERDVNIKFRKYCFLINDDKDVIFFIFYLSLLDVKEKDRNIFSLFGRLPNAVR